MANLDDLPRPSTRGPWEVLGSEVVSEDRSLAIYVPDLADRVAIASLDRWIKKCESLEKERKLVVEALMNLNVTPAQACYAALEILGYLPGKSHD